MKRWTEAKALEYLLDCGAERNSTKTIFKRDGWNGLTACSAMDYLIKLNYKFTIINSNKPKKAKNTGEAIAGVSILEPKILCYNIDTPTLKTA